MLWCCGQPAKILSSAFRSHAAAGLQCGWARAVATSAAAGIAQPAIDRLAAEPANVGDDAQQHADPQASLLPTVAIVGRPNVGKSALFNRLVRRRDALVHNTPGGHVTRDYKEGTARLGDLEFRCIDTSGLEPFMEATSLQARATELTVGVLERSDVALLLLDARAGIGTQDSALAKWLRRNVTAPVIPVANKCERRGAKSAPEVADVIVEATRLGFGEAAAISAETGDGMSDLYDVLQPHVSLAAERLQEQAATDAEAAQQAAAAGAGADIDSGSASGRKEITLTLIGLPNVGKSTLSNRLLGRQRSLTGPEPGLTRDVVRATFHHDPYTVHLMDTAGRMRKRRLANYDDAGGLVAAKTLAQGTRSMQMSQTVALLLDAQSVLRDGGPTREEIRLASSVAAEGRSLVLIANKTDTLRPSERQQVQEILESKFAKHVPEVTGVPIICTSALTGSGMQQLMPAVMGAYDIWTLRIPTSRLNRWIEKVKAEYAGSGGTVKELAKIRYMTQVKARPPTFAVFTRSDDLSERTRKLVLNAIRRNFNFAGVPIRILVRTSADRRKAGLEQ